MKKKQHFTRVGALLSAVVLALTLCPVSPLESRAAADITWSSTYSPQKAAYYAQTYAYSKNNSYVYYEDNDCANFVSQALQYGDFGLDYSSWYYAEWSSPFAWRYCPSMAEFISQKRGKLIKNPSWSDIQVGDLIFYDFPKAPTYAPDGVYDHVTIVTGIGASGIPLVCGHTTDRLNEVYNYPEYATPGTAYTVAQLTPRGQASQTYQTASTYNYTSYTPPAASYALDVNATLDGAACATLGSFGTVDVYVNGVLRGDDVTDFCELVTVGSSYEIRDIKAKSGYTYLGLPAFSGFFQGYLSLSLPFITDWTAAYTQAAAAPSYSYDYSWSWSGTGSWTIYCGWNLVSFSQAPYVSADNRLMVPAEPLVKALGGTLYWSTSAALNAYYNDQLVVMYAGSSIYSVAGVCKVGCATPTTKDGVLYVGLRDLAEAMGATVATDNYSRIVNITR